MRDVFVAGAASTPFGKYMDRSLRSLAEDAARCALADCGAQPHEIEAAFFANAAAGLLTGQEMIRGEVSLRNTGLLGIPIINVENACASGSSAFHLAWMAVGSGYADIAIAIGAEKMTHREKTRMFAAFNGAVDTEEFHLNGDVPRRSLFMELYADMAREYMRTSGATEHDFAAVAVKSHANAAKNPRAQYRVPVTAEEVLTSRLVAAPLTLLMCSPIGDGAAAVVLSSEVGLRRLHADPVKVLASVVLTARGTTVGNDSVVTRAAKRAYFIAGIRSDDLDVIELHDAAAPAELIVLEELGVAPPGQAAGLLMSGASALGGRIPVNPSGGLLSKGHPIGATGCAQIAEIVDQLRDRCGERQVRGAEVGLAENGGGWLAGGPAVGAVTILQRA